MAKQRRVIDADYYEDNGSERRVRRSVDKEDNRPQASNRVDEYEDEQVERRARRRRHQTDNSSNKTNSGGNTNSNAGPNPMDFSNIDFSQIASMLQNVDMNQLSSMLSGMGGLGGLGNLAGMFMGGAPGAAAGGGAPTQGRQPMPGAIPFTGDRRIDLLNAVRPMVTPERAGIIDMIIQLYTISKILRR